MDNKLLAVASTINREEKDSIMTTTDRKVRILCVEEYDQQMRTFLQAQLKARNFQVQTVRDGAQAIDMAAIFEPQLVLLTCPSLHWTG